MGARDLDRGEIDFVHEDLFFLEARLGDDLPGRVGDEALAPELDAVAANRAFEAHPVVTAT